MKFFKLLFLCFVCILLGQCASNKLVKNPPFKVISATYFSRVGGMPNSPGGTEVRVSYISDNEIKFDSIFFRAQKAKTGSYVNTNGKTVRALFYQTSTNNDMNMHNEVTKEYGNKPPIKSKRNLFNLKDDEIVISYIENNTTKYYKINNIKKGKTVIMQ